MLKYLSMALVALSFTLAPVAKAQDASKTESTPTQKVEKKADSKTAGVKSEKECEHCKHKNDKKADKDCHCSKKDCDSGECKKKSSKKYCKHCAEHKTEEGKEEQHETH